MERFSSLPGSKDDGSKAKDGGALETGGDMLKHKLQEVVSDKSKKSRIYT